MEKQKLRVDDFKMTMHLNMTNQGVLQHSGTIHCPTRIDLHGKQLYRDVITPKKRGVWGKGKAHFYLSDKDSPQFETIAAFCEHYCVELEAPQNATP